MNHVSYKTIAIIITVLAVVCGILSCFDSVYVGTSLPDGMGGYFRSFAHRLVICCGLIEITLLFFRHLFCRGFAILNALIRVVGPWLQIRILEWIAEPVGGHGPGNPCNLLPYLITVLSVVSLLLNIVLTSAEYQRKKS